MDIGILKKEEQLYKAQKRQKLWQRVIAGVSAFVLLCTNYLPILPALALEQETFCGIEAHVHEDACYELKPAVSCGLTESEGHAHSVACYASFLCGLEVTEGHAHGEGCYASSLVCELLEEAGHTHEESCYVLEQICTMDEVQGHAHTLECCDPESLSCALAETDGHAHEESCYTEEEQTLTCGKEIHIHDLNCFSDPTADVETSADWQASVSDVTLTGNWGKDLVAIAVSQLGYSESTANYQIGTDGAQRGYTRYGAWLGDPYCDWSGAFAAFCLNYAKVKNIPTYSSNCSGWLTSCTNAGLVKISDYTAVPGDLVFMDDDADGNADHVGIVRSNSGSLVVIVGDNSNTVSQRTNPSVLAVVTLPVNPAMETKGTEAAETTGATETTAAAAETTESTEATEAGENAIMLLADEDIVTGTCGANLTWSLDKTTGVLTISGTGEMSEYASAADVPWNGYATTINNVVLDDSISSIGAYAFYGCSNLTSVQVPNSVVKIGEGAFASCTSLSIVNIPEGVTSIAPGTFNTCSNLKEIEIPTGVTSIGTGAFAGSGLTRVNIPHGVESIANAAFSSCESLSEIDFPDSLISIGNAAFPGSGLKRITIPGSVTSIGASAFASCTNLESVTLPAACLSTPAFGGCNNLKEIIFTGDIDTLDADLLAGMSSVEKIVFKGNVGKIDSNVFANCPNLKKVIFEGNVGEIAVNAFSGCKNLAEVAFKGELESIGAYAFSGCSNLTSIDIPEGVSSIGEGAFFECTGLTEVSIPSTMETVADKAFYRCINLQKVHITSLDVWNNIEFGEFGSNPLDTGAKLYLEDGSVMLPEGITEIPDNYFLNNTDITAISIPDTVRRIGQNAFKGCTNLEQVIFMTDENGNCALNEIDNNAFNGCSSLTSIDVPDGITTISDGTFAFCSNLSSVTLPDSVTTIEAGAFHSCSCLTEIDLPDGLTSIGESAFQKSGLTSIEIPSGVKTIEINVFSGCESLVDVTLSEGLEVIRYYAFRNCTALKEIIFPSTLKKIEDGPAFEGCSALETIVFNEGLESIGQVAFRECIALTKVELPDSLTTLQGAAFADCVNLETVILPDNLTNLNYGTFSGCAYLKYVEVSSQTFIQNGAFTGCEDATIAIRGDIDTVDAAFMAPFANVKNIRFLGNVGKIAANAFAGCPNLESVQIDGNVGTIATNAFSGLQALTDLYIKGDVETIEKCAFEHKYSQAIPTATMKSVTIDGDVSKIEEYAFAYCSSLESVYLNGTVPEISDYMFYYSYNLKNFPIPNGVKTIGERAFEYCSSLTEVIMPDSVEEIGLCAFNRCSSLLNVKLSENLSTIGDYAFQYCYKMQEITIPQSVREIGECAFGFCQALSDIVLQNGLIRIGDSAFYNCINLEEITIPGTVEEMGRSVFMYCSALKELKIPDSVVSIGYSICYLCSNLVRAEVPASAFSTDNIIFNGCSKLDTIVLTGSGVEIQDNVFNKGLNSLKTIIIQSDDTTASEDTFANASLEKIVVGMEVDSLSGDLFKYLTDIAVEFEGTNYFNLYKAINNSNLPGNLGSLEAGDYFVDEFGVIYALDNDTMTATLVHAQTDMEDYTIPATIPTEDGTGVYIVNRIKGHAFSQMKSLSNVNIPADQEVAVGDGSFVGTDLSSVNGKETLDEIYAALPNAVFYPMSFFDTRFYEDLDWEETTDDIVLNEDNNLQIKLSTDTEGISLSDDEYLFLTGMTPITNIHITNLYSDVTSDKYVRVYVLFDPDDPYCNTQYPLGEQKFGDVIGRVVRTDYSNGYYYEFDPLAAGDTLNLNIRNTYRNGYSDGGEARIFAVVLDAQQRAALGNSVPQIGQYHRLSWTTQNSDFALKNNTPTNVIEHYWDGSSQSLRERPIYRFSLEPESVQNASEYGADYVSSVKFAAEVELPDDVVWGTDIARGIFNIRRISSNNISVLCFLYGNNELFRISELNLGETLDPELFSYHFVQNDAGENVLVIEWSYVNPDPYSSEISSLCYEINFMNSEFVRLPNDVIPQNGKTYSVEMEVTADITYQHSRDDATENTFGERRFKIANESINFSWTKDKTSMVAGAANNMYLRIKNNSSIPAYLKDVVLTEKIPDYFYLSARDLQRLFDVDQPCSDALTVTISNAYFCTPVSQVVYNTGRNACTITATHMGTNVPYGCSEWASSSDRCSTRTVGTITITRAEGKDTVFMSKNGTTVETTLEDIQSVLDSWGFVVGYNTAYNLRWEIDALDLDGKQQIEIPVPFHAKDSFMLLSKDMRYALNNKSLGSILSSSTYVMPKITYYMGNAEGEYIDASGKPTSKWNAMTGSDSEQGLFPIVTSDFYIQQQPSVLRNSRWVSTAGDGVYVDIGDVLRFDLSVKRRLASPYAALPIVDRLSDGLSLLIPVKNNSSLSSIGLSRQTVQGVQYCVLDRLGTYRNVYVGGKYADRVIVSDEGTMIYWYVSDSMTESGEFDAPPYESLTFDVYAIVQANSETGAATIENEFWLNDHQTHRLWDHGVVRTNIPMAQKDIVTSFGETPINDVVVDVHNIVEGESVTYRLTILSTRGTAGPITAYGKDMYDILPYTVQSWPWSADNVSISYYDESQLNCQPNSGEWSIQEWRASNVHQRLTWSDDFSITFTDKTYIYMTLDFPEGNAWEEYVESHGAYKIANTFHVYSSEDSAYVLPILPAQAVIQKGVLETGLTMVDDDYYRSDGEYQGNALHYYENSGYDAAYVTYYVSIYNSGKGRLYIDSIQDILPDGFTFLELVEDLHVTPTVSNGSAGYSINLNHNYASYPCIRTVSVDGNRLTFNLSNWTGNDRIGYDSNVDCVYLGPGTHAYFAYNCLVSDYAKTDDEATNQLGVCFYNYADLGVEIGDDTLASPYRVGTDPNEGGCEMMDSQTADRLGFQITDNPETESWMYSDVTVRRETIVPGLRKEVAFITDSFGNVKTDTTTAEATDTVTWRVTARNDSRTPIDGYYLTDVMNYPYAFAGDVRYTMNRPDSDPVDLRLFSISDERIINQNGNELLVLTQYDGSEVKVVMDGSWVTVKVASDIWIKVRFYKEITDDPDRPNEVMSIQFPIYSSESNSRTLIIPGGGTGQLLVSTRNLVGVSENLVYYNNSYLSPMQPFNVSHVTQGVVTDYQIGTSAMPSVRASCPIAVTYGYSTSSRKQVTELDDFDNTAYSDAETNVIAIDGVDDTFRYSLYVSGSMSAAMDRLVLIDNLPQLNDHSAFNSNELRYSEYQVVLTESPDFVVTVYADGDTTGTVLSPNNYRLSFSTAAGPYSDEDWAGEGTSWSASYGSDTRSIRLVIQNDADAQIMPAGCTVVLSFNAKPVDGLDINDVYGKTAWNGFGYSYQIDSQVSRSAPGYVGVRFPSLPVLEKQLKNSAGEAVQAVHQETFPFLIYEGEALDFTGKSDAEIAQMLADRSFTIAHITVEPGESYAEIPLGGLKLFAYENGWKTTQADWIWVDGAEYTFVELSDADGIYEFGSLGGSETNSHTVTYSALRSVRIQAVNIHRTWQIALNKVNENGAPLAGAWFGLYSPNAQDSMTEAEVSSYELDESPGLTCSVDGKDYYLTAIAQSDASGVIFWSGLDELNYVVLELQAPDGYRLSETTRKVSWMDDNGGYPAVVTLEVINNSSYELPKTGGIGTTVFYVVGGLMIFAAIVLLIVKKRKKE